MKTPSAREVGSASISARIERASSRLAISTSVRSGASISSAARLPDYNVPTYREAGFPDLVANIWFSLSGPAALSPDIVNRLNSEVRRVLQLPDVRARLRPEGIEPGNLDAKAFTEFVAAEVKRWAPVVKASGAKAD